MPESRKLARADAADLVIESGLSRSRQVLAAKAVQKDGPPCTYGPHGAEYDADELQAWIDKQKAKRGLK
jgi:hypothetical protein